MRRSCTLYENLVDIVRRLLKGNREQLLLVGIKALSLGVNLFIVKISYILLGLEHYGIWAGIYGALSWLVIADFGLANGFRDYVLSYGKRATRRLYLESASTLTVANAIIAIFAIGLYASWWVLRGDSHSVVFVQFLSVGFVLSCINIPVKAVAPVLLSLDKPALSTVPYTGGLITTALVLAITLVTVGEISPMSYAGAVVGPQILIGGVCYVGLTRHLKGKQSPQYRKFDANRFRAMFRTGKKFLLLQLGGVLVLGSAIPLTLYFAGAEEAAILSVGYRCSVALLVVFSGITLPVWTRVKTHWLAHNTSKISSAIGKMNKYLIVFAVAACALGVLLNSITGILLSEADQLSEASTALLVLFVILLMRSSMFTQVANGMGLLDMQLKVNGIQVALIMPAVLVIKFAFETDGSEMVLGGLCLIAALPALIYPVVIQRQIVSYNRGMGKK